MTIKQLGGVFGRNPTFNDVTIEGQLTFDGDIDINSDLKVDGDLDVTGGMTVDTDTLVVDDANNRVGVGTAAPLVKNETKISTSGLPASTGTAQPNACFRAASSATTGIIDIGIFGANSWIQATDSGDLSQGYNLSLNPNGGDVKVGNGNLVISTSGKGIDFSATAGTGTSELLDDYEEGVWTVNYAPTTGAFTTITTVGTGRYTKVGRLVTVFGSVYTSGALDVTGASGNLKITGLPYACNATVAGGGADISHQSWNLGTDILNTRMYVGIGASEILMYKNTMNGSSFPSGNITVADMSTSGGSFSNLITFTASYEV